MLLTGKEQGLDYSTFMYAWQMKGKKSFLEVAFTIYPSSSCKKYFSEFSQACGFIMNENLLGFTIETCTVITSVANCGQ